MKYFDKRIAALSKMEEDMWKCTHVSDTEILNNLENNETGSVIIPTKNIYNLQHVLNNIESNTLSDNIAQEDENSNFEEVEIMEIQALKPYEIIGAENINIVRRSDDKHSVLGNISDNKNTNKQFAVISDTRSMNMLETPTNMNNIYKCNNERSSLQEFLRSEVVKELQSEGIKNPFKVQSVINDDVTSTLMSHAQTNVEIHNKDNRILDRPKVLEIERLDNMTEAQRNKIRMLKHEFGITPNNNQSNLFIMERRPISDNFIIKADSLSEDNNRNYESSDVTNNINNDQTKCIEAIGSITKNSKVVEEMSIEENLEFFGKVNNINEIAQISSTTDTFASSINSILTNLQISEDISPLDVNSLSSSSNTKLNGAVSSVFPEHYNVNISTPLTSNDVNASDFTSLTIADVELIDNTSLQVYLEKSIIIPLQIQSRIVNDALIKYLLNEHNMLLHLQSLRSYFFLLNGEFAKCLTNSLYARLYEISVPIELFNSATLTNVLERALISSFSSNYLNSELLSLSAIDTPMQLHVGINIVKFMKIFCCSSPILLYILSSFFFYFF